MRALVTGFEPFGGESINPSWESVKLLPDRIGSFEISKLCIPVIFGDAAKSVIDAARTLDPDIIICIGQAGGRSAITPEFVGINLRHASSPDNAGNLPIDEAIISGGKTAYFSTLPMRKIIDAINDEGIPAAASYSAGTYVCNDVLYTLLAHFENAKTRAGFIHVPYSTEQGKNESPSLPVTDMAKAIEAAIRACTETSND